MMLDDDTEGLKDLFGMQHTIGVGLQIISKTIIYYCSEIRSEIDLYCPETMHIPNEKQILYIFFSTFHFYWHQIRSSLYFLTFLYII